MKLHIEIDQSEEGDPAGLSCQETGARQVARRNIDVLASILALELASLYPEVERQAATTKASGEISLTFMTPDEIRAINKEHRGIDEPTDVLSFPLWEIDGAFMPEFFMPGILPLGDIIICAPEAERLCDTPPLDALCLVLAHGFLHLLAMDHDTPEKEAEMWKRQDALAARLLAALNAQEAA
ncbi:hypothetical protein AGMMS49957_04290 [Synergistales bacterium]|nr:hypothetical protein AGMMS49957_04290 [Synergistales bacterium]